MAAKLQTYTICHSNSDEKTVNKLNGRLRYFTICICDSKESATKVHQKLAGDFGMLEIKRFDNIVLLLNPYNFDNNELCAKIGLTEGVASVTMANVDRDLIF